jgi:hypothetical protein
VERDQFGYGGGRGVTKSDGGHTMMGCHVSVMVHDTFAVERN